MIVKFLKRVFKRNTHNFVFKILAGFGKSLLRLYENRNHDLYSNGELWLIKSIAKLKPNTILDVGGNVGEYAELLAKYCPTATIYTFEPVKDTFVSLVKRIEKYTKVHPWNFGLFREDTEIDINLFSEHQLSSLYYVPDGEIALKEKIKLLKGDKFLTERKIETIDFLKVDVEGGEMDVFLGLEGAISKRKIRVIQFEYGIINIRTKNLLLDFYLFFETHGYVLGKLYPKGVEFRAYDVKHEDFIGPNFVAVQKDDEVAKRLLSL